MPKIGLDARVLAARGGITSYTRNLITSLELLRPDVDLIVFTPRGESGRIGTTFPRHALRTPREQRFERALLSAELARFRLDLLHSPDFIPPLHGARRHLITVHDLGFMRFPEFMTEGSRRYYNDRIRWAVEKADHILATSESTKTDLVDVLGVPPAKVTVHLQGVAPAFRPLPPTTLEGERTRLGLPDSFFLFVGTLEPRKNVPTLLEAYRRFRAGTERPPSLVIVGQSGWLFDDRTLRADGVMWLPTVGDGSLPAIYNLALALVLPSFYEGFGLPALEAMACGTAPIVSRNSSLPEIVADVGALIEPSDPDSIVQALRRALDPEWRRAQGQAALRRTDVFSPHRAAEITLNLYERLSGR